MGTIESWKQKVKQLNNEIYALYLAYKDLRTPLYAKIFIALVVGYAFSPIDLIPDPIPVLGYLNEAILLPLDVILARKMIPAEVLAETRQKARKAMISPSPQSRQSVWQSGGGAVSSSGVYLPRIRVF
jgi:uncharacterized membrane protein YkvA (DUF1232 family)